MAWFLGITVGSGIVAALFFLYHLRKGQFDDVEDIKYQMFRDEEANEDD